MNKTIFGFIIFTLIVPGVILSQSSEAGKVNNVHLQITELGFSKIVDLIFEQALVKVKSELEKEGFGILTEVDVCATMKKKLDVDFRPYQILGACNPPLAHKALQSEEQIGLMLPCKFIVYVNDDKKTVVAAVDPSRMMQGIENEQLTEVAKTVREKFKKVLTMV
jgi:uncharacterized protein (DUF302 family)